MQVILIKGTQIKVRPRVMEVQSWPGIYGVWVMVAQITDWAALYINERHAQMRGKKERGVCVCFTKTLSPAWGEHA